MERKLRRKLRNLLLGVCLCTMSCVFSACGRQEQKQVEITVIHGWGSTEDDHVAMRKIYSDFEKENPDVKVHLASMPTSSDLLRKVGDMAQTGEIPDVIYFGGTGKNVIYDFMVKNDLAVDLMPYIEGDEAFAGCIADSNLEYWKTVDGKLYSVADTLMLSGGYWYNEEIFRNAGVQKIPETWEEFADACEAVKAWGIQEGNNVLPLQVSAEGYLYFFDHMLVNNRKKTSSLGKMEIREAEFRMVLEQLGELYPYSAAGSENYSYRDETDLFNDGKLAIYVNGVWGAPMISEEIQAQYALFPTDGSYTMSCESAGIGYILGKTGEEKQQEASIRFLKYLLSREVQERILLETEQVPANPDVDLEAHKEEMQRFYQAAKLVQSADKKIETPDNLWDESAKSAFEEHIIQALEQKISAEEFIDFLD